MRALSVFILFFFSTVAAADVTTYPFGDRLGDTAGDSQTEIFSFGERFDGGVDPIRVIGRLAGGIVRGAGSSLYPQGSVFPPHSVLEGVAVDFEFETQHINTVSQVLFSLSDGTTTVEKTVTEETISAYVPTWHLDKDAAAVQTGRYIASFTGAEIQSLDDVEVTLTITSSSSDGYDRVQTHTFLNNAGSTRTVVEKYVDSVGGDDGTGDGTEGNPYLTWEVAAEQAATTANGSISDPEDVIPVVNCQAGTYELAQVGTSTPNYARNLTWLTTRPATGVAKADVTLANYTGNGTHIVRFLRFSDLTIDIADDPGAGGTSSALITAGHASVYTSSNPDSAWVDQCKVTHHLDRNGQEIVGVASWIAIAQYDSPVWITGTEMTEMAQDGCAFAAYHRDVKIHKVAGDIVNDPYLFIEFDVFDNSQPHAVVAVSSTTGATVGGLVYGTTSTTVATITAIRSASVVIDTEGGTITVHDYKTDENVSNGIEFYAAGETPGVDTPAGTATHSPVHSDFMQNNTGSTDKNQIVRYGRALDIEGQFLFTTASTYNAWWANVYGSVNTSGYLSQLGHTSGTPVIHHMLIENVTCTNQTWYARPESNVTFEHVRFKHVVARDFTGDIPVSDAASPANGIIIEDCHATVESSSTYQTNSGDPLLVDAPAFDEFVGNDTSKNDFSPTAGSPLLGMIAAGERLSKYDALGDEIPNDGTGAIGAVSQVTGGDDPDPGSDDTERAKRLLWRFGKLDNKANQAVRILSP